MAARTSKSGTISSSEGSDKRENILYVVLHGAICLVDVGASGFRAYLIDMGDEHAYLYGDWLFEKLIPEKAKGQWPLEANLDGVDSPPKVNGQNTLDPNENVIVNISAPPSEPYPNNRALIYLPRPRKIYNFVSGTLAANSILGTKDDIKKIEGNPVDVSGIRVFEYTFADIDKVALFDDTEDGIALWTPPEPATLLKKPLNISILHIYDEPSARFPDKTTASEHNLEEFNLSMRVLGVQIKMEKEAGKIQLPKEKPDGLLPEEYNTLDSRERLVLRVLNVNRGGAVPKPDDSDDDRGGGSGGQVCGGAQGVVTGGGSVAKKMLRRSKLKKHQRKEWKP